METTAEYIADVDSKKRVTLRGSQYKHYSVHEYENGCILLEPRELVAPADISARTLADMDAAIANFKTGTVSDPIDLSDF